MSTSVLRNRTKRKAALLVAFGFKCQICDYDKCQTALEFHHISSESKLFSLSSNDKYTAYKDIANEAKKCVMVCANCHREIHAGLVKIELKSNFDEDKFLTYLKLNKPKKTCKICQNEIESRKSFCSMTCRKKFNEHGFDQNLMISMYERDKKSFMFIGRYFNVSGTTIKKRLLKIGLLNK